MSRLEPLNVPLKDVARYMLHQCSRHKRKVIISYLAVTTALIMTLLVPFTYEWLINAMSRPGERNFDALFKPILAVVLTSVVFHILTRTAHFLNCYTTSHVEASVAWETAGKVHHFETEWHANHFVGSIVTAMKRGRSASHILIDLMCYEFWPAFFVTAGSIVLMMRKSVEIGIFFIIFAVLFVTCSILMGRYYVLPINRRSSAEDSSLGGVIADSITGQAVVKSFGAEKREESRLRRACEKWRKVFCLAMLRGNQLSLVQNILINFGRVGSLTIAAYLWSHGKFTPGEVVYVLMSQRVMGDYLDAIGNNLNRVTVALNDMEEVVAWNKREAPISSQAGARPLCIVGGGIEFKNVTFFYNEKSKPALSNFSLNIKPGEKIALVGPSGGGKSTVMKLLQRLYEPQQGTIAVDEQFIHEYDLPSMRAAMGLVPQDPILFHRSLADNIAYARPDATPEEIRDAAQKAQIAHLIETLPHKYETLVGERGIKLSGGERQRVAIARAILANTPILLLDEATSALDSEAEGEIQTAIAAASQGRTMIAIAHRLSTIQSADRIIVLSQGRILEQGSHRELLGLNDGLYRRLYESQAKGFLPDHVV